MDYVETDCTVAHAGQGYTAGGAIVTAQRIIAYPGPDNLLQDWHGRPLGRWRAVASWRRHAGAPIASTRSRPSSPASPTPAAGSARA